MSDCADGNSCLLHFVFVHNYSRNAASGCIFPLVAHEHKFAVFASRVRLLTIYLYGWRAIFYLLPGHLLTWSYLWFVLQSEQDISASLISILAGFLAVCLVFRTWNYHSDSELRSHWKLIILAGVLASIGNGLGHATLYGLQLDVNWLILALGFLIGDVSGLFFLMVTLILINRFARVRSL